MNKKNLSSRRLVRVVFLNGKSQFNFIDFDNFVSFLILKTYNGNYKLSSINKIKVNDIFCYDVFDIYSGKYLACNLKEWI